MSKKQKVTTYDIYKSIRKFDSDFGFEGSTVTKVVKPKKGKGAYSRKEKHRKPFY